MLIPLIPLILICVLLDVVREVCFKRATLANAVTPEGRLILPLPSAGFAWGGLGAAVWIVELLLWAQVLGRAPLNIAFPIMSLTYAFTPLAGKLMFAEQISPRRWRGIALVTAGAVLIGTLGKY